MRKKVTERGVIIRYLEIGRLFFSASGKPGRHVLLDFGVRKILLITVRLPSWRRCYRPRLSCVMVRGKTLYRRLPAGPITLPPDLADVALMVLQADEISRLPERRVP